MTTPLQWRQATIQRDRWNRPLIVHKDDVGKYAGNGLPKDTGKRTGDGIRLVPYTRVTTFIDVLDNKYNLQQWKMRKVAEGLALRPDLLMLVSSLGPQPEEDDEYKQWRSKMDETCQQALEAAEASAKANIGTALHAYTDRIDRGQPLGKVPKEYQQHLKNYESVTAPLTSVHIEKFVINDQYETGGTADRFSMIDGHDKLIVADTKTGDISWGMAKFAMQKGLYANSTFYNPETGERTPIPNVDLERALIIHLDAKTGKCKLVWVDIKSGWEGVALANSVRNWQKRKDFQSPYMPRDLVAEAHANIVQGIAQATTVEELYNMWKMYGSSWLPEHVELAAARKAQLNGS